MKILLVIPALDEEPTLPELIPSAKTRIQDILVVDDGSSDATARVAGAAGAMTHRFPANRGKGVALKFAFEYAVEKGYDWIFTMDGDGQHAVEDLQNFFPLLDRYDLILGNRMNNRRGVPLIRRIANFSSSLLVSIACRQWIPDSQSGFRAYSAKLLRAVELRSDRYELETEVIIKAARKGLRIGHATIQTIYAGEVSRFKNLKDSLRFLRVMAKSLFWR